MSENKYEGCKRGFTQLSKAWYADANLKNSKYSDQIMVGYYADEGGTPGEFSIKWKSLSNNSVPRLMVYDDSWAVLTEFSDLLDKMAEVDDKNITPDEFARMLESLGIENMTQFESGDNLLMPCPFCKEMPKYPGGDGTQYEIICDCGMANSCVQISDLMTREESMGSKFESNNHTFEDEYILRAKKEATKMWNTRA